MTPLIRKSFSATVLITTATFLMLTSFIQAQELVFPTDAIDKKLQFPPQAPTNFQAKVVAPVSPKNTVNKAVPAAKKSVVPNYRGNMPKQAMRMPPPPPPVYQNQYPNRNQYQYPNQVRNYPNYPRNNNNNNFFPFSNNMPFGNNSNNGFNPFNNGNMPFSGNSFSNPMNNMFGNNNNGNMPFFGNTNSNRKKAWGNKRNIWPDFYTDFTDEAWDTMTSGPRDLGRMPGGWRFPHISTPDPVTVSDAITNQFPPIAEEAGNMMDFSDWGVFE